MPKAVDLNHKFWALWFLAKVKSVDNLQVKCVDSKFWVSKSFPNDRTFSNHIIKKDINFDLIDLVAIFAYAQYT